MSEKKRLFHLVAERSLAGMLGFVFFIAGTFAALPRGYAEENVRWPQWRGERHDGISEEIGLPTTWNEKTGENILWVKPIPPWGSSTPVIWGDKMFFTTQTEEKELLVLCLNRLTGEELWRQAVGVPEEDDRTLDYSGKEGEGRKRQQFHAEHNQATPSCVTDGQRVICHFGTGDLAAFTLDGAPLWKRNLQEMFGTFSIWWGHANSPVLFEDLVIVASLQDPCMGLGEKDIDSYIVAFYKETGEVAWRTLRNVGVDREPADAYITMPIQEVNGEPQMLVVAGLCADAYHPRTGERLWWYPGLIGNRNVTSPIFAGELGIFTQGHRKGVMALPLDKKGELSEKDVVWVYERNCPDSSNPVFYDGKLFMVANDGIAQCLEAASGDVLWTKRLEDNHRASPVVADGKLFFLNFRGRTLIMVPSGEDEELGEGRVEDTTFASLVIVDGKIYLRGREKMYCIGLRLGE